MPDRTIGVIELQREEAEIWAMIKLDHQDREYNHERNSELVVRLMKLLLARGAIPEPRLKYFDDPSYRTKSGLRGSHRDMLERNSRDSGDKIYRLPAFLQYLRYFVCGANLPLAVVKELSKRAYEFGHVSGSDAAELGQLAKQLIRQNGLAPQDVAEEFYRLALDCGIYHTWAMTIRNAVKNMPVASR